MSSLLGSWWRKALQVIAPNIRQQVYVYIDFDELQRIAFLSTKEREKHFLCARDFNVMASGILEDVVGFSLGQVASETAKMTKMGRFRMHEDFWADEGNPRIIWRRQALRRPNDDTVNGESADHGCAERCAYLSVPTKANSELMSRFEVCI
ncbi:uncharacterized protein ARMOST_06671 [Armillaria ostoyae]|uniref:Uncharacterized protein n=1 Tax=Armillaria ostoyae TaxID=47428 RepID=A0A284R3P2_ARMOS|nr:uncharacterized protein ARMOST_06671 [Armillaria ostoyae]